MTELAKGFSHPGGPGADGGNVKCAAGALPADELCERALRQAARELLLAQSSDWPFILSTGTSPGYARARITEHLSRFTKLYEQIIASQIDEERLASVESQDNLFPNLNYRYFG